MKNLGCITLVLIRSCTARVHKSCTALMGGTFMGHVFLASGKSRVITTPSRVISSRTPQLLSNVPTTLTLLLLETCPTSVPRSDGLQVSQQRRDERS